MNSSSGKLSGRTALITGGGQGVGRGIARCLAQAGANVVIAQRNAEQGESEAKDLQDSFGVKASYIQTDVTKPEDIERMVAFTQETYGALDILVNNAGGSRAKRLENTTDADMERWFNVNYWGTFRAMRAAFPGMKSRGWGRIINLASLNGVNAHMYTAPYNASKEAVRALSRTAAVEWGAHGITVNIICPAAATPASEAYFEANPEMLKKTLEEIPCRKLGNSERDVGPVAVFLASDDSAYLTGETFFVDGGAHINGVTWRPYIGD